MTALKTVSFILAYLMFPIVAFSQNKLVDEKDNSPIPYAHILIDNRFYSYSNEKGEFLVNLNQKFDTVKIVHLSYETKRLAYNDVEPNGKITLKEKYNTLDEVAININQKKKKTKTLLPEKALRDYTRSRQDIRLLYETGTTIGQEKNRDSIDNEKAIFIPNEHKEQKALITKILLNSTDKKIKGDTKYAPFKVNLSTYDTVTKLPKQKIFKEDLAIGKMQGETIIITLTPEQITEFPKEGICVVVSVYSSQHYAENGLTNPPKFDVVSLKSSSGFREYARYRHTPVWEEQSYSQTREQVFNFGIEVEFVE